MKAKEIRQQSEKQIQDLITENKEKLKKLRFNLFNRQLKNYKEIKSVKKIIARAKGVLKEKELLEENKSSER